MKANTKYFGEIEYEASDLVYLTKGLFGFEAYHEYLLIHFGDSSSLFMCLQSTENPDLSFILADPFTLIPDYSPVISREYADLPELSEDSRVIYYSICVLKSPLDSSTLNLKAPLVINTDTRRGWQVMTENKEYTLRHPFSEFHIKGGKPHADSSTEKG